MSGAILTLPQYVFMAWCLVKHRDSFNFYFTIGLSSSSSSSSSSFLGSTAQLRPWPPPQNSAEFLGGFSTIFFFTG
jgi:hypothetical protein